MRFIRLAIIAIIQWTVVVTAVDFNDVFKLVSSTVCTVMSAPKLGKCADTFIHELRESEVEALKAYNARGYCCAFNHLKTCIVDNVDNCGDRKDEVVDQLVSSVVDTVKDISVSSDDCDTFTGYVGTVLCQQDWLLIVEAIGLLFICLTACCQVIRCCCCGSSGGRRSYSTQMLVVPERQIPGHKYP
ncbi:unnamed protein product [Oppiella nova]|uniref:Uncharacterized protein n=1 Tax=Oppiella nova TaxID=334625 RepID=A0A7R9M8C2_9ACAR|nr:unnamed protein product [Oppiella nova]CAG2171513.1 unnamed protein product [Oppiella nova]